MQPLFDSQNKSVGQLLEEVQLGESRLEASAGRPRRVVSVLNLLVRDARGRVLVEEASILPNGTRRERNLPVSEKLKHVRHWDQQGTAPRSPHRYCHLEICRERTGGMHASEQSGRSWGLRCRLAGTWPSWSRCWSQPTGKSRRRRCHSELRHGRLAVYHISRALARAHFRSYPGLPCLYRLHRVEARVQGLPEGEFETREQREDGWLVSRWSWRDPSSQPGLQVS